MAKYSKLDTEFKLLKREHCKAEVRIKSLQRDLLRMQAHFSSNSDSAAAFQAEKQFLVDRVTHLGFEKEEILAKLEGLRLALEDRENESNNLRRENGELTAKNTSLALELEELRLSSVSALKRPQRELVSTGVNTDMQSHSSSSRDQWRCDEKPKSISASSPMRLMMGDPEALTKDTLETNILRLTRLADALLGRDESSSC